MSNSLINLSFTAKKLLFFGKQLKEACIDALNQDPPDSIKESIRTIFFSDMDELLKEAKSLHGKEKGVVLNKIDDIINDFNEIVQKLELKIPSLRKKENIKTDEVNSVTIGSDSEVIKFSVNAENYDEYQYSLKISIDGSQRSCILKLIVGPKDLKALARMLNMSVKNIEQQLQ